jgi:hypothetical protein
VTDSLLVLGVGAHVPHPVELHTPQELPELLMIVSDFSIVSPFSHRRRASTSATCVGDFQ